MNLLNDDLKIINFQFLMLARECARHQPMEAIWKFNLSDAEIQRMSSMSLDEVKELAGCGRAVFTILPVAQTPSRTSSNIAAALLPVTTPA